MRVRRITKSNSPCFIYVAWLTTFLPEETQNVGYTCKTVRVIPEIQDGAEGWRYMLFYTAACCATCDIQEWFHLSFNVSVCVCVHVCVLFFIFFCILPLDFSSVHNFFFFSSLSLSFTFLHCNFDPSEFSIPSFPEST